MLDEVLKKYGIKYIFVQSSASAIKEKCFEVGIDYSPEWTHWIELSWGCGYNDDEMFDYALNDFGTSFDDAMCHCLASFLADHGEVATEIKRHYKLEA